MVLVIHVSDYLHGVGYTCICMFKVIHAPCVCGVGDVRYVSEYLYRTIKSLRKGFLLQALHGNKMLHIHVCLSAERFLWSSTLSSICIRAGVLKFDWLAYLTIGPEVGVSNLCQDRKLSQDFFLIWNYAAPREVSGAD